MRALCGNGNWRHKWHWPARKHLLLRGGEHQRNEHQKPVLCVCIMFMGKVLNVIFVDKKTSC